LKKILSLSLISCLFLTTACNSSKTSENNNTGQKVYNIVMMADTGGINDKSFNESAWSGLKKLEQENKNVKVSSLESHQAADYFTNMDKLSDGNYDLIFSIGFMTKEAVIKAVKDNSDKSYCLVDGSYSDTEKTPGNMTGILFKAQESSFLVGYIAGKVTKSNKVGFVGGMKIMTIDQFEYGYRAGVLQAAKELNKNIEVVSQCAESFDDAAKGKAIASKMFLGGCDIVFHAAAGTGTGVIEAAKESGKFAIGVDMDQSGIAPKNVLTSALKNVGDAVKTTSEKFIKGEKIGGQTITYGLKENCVGIPENHENFSDEVYKDVLKIREKIVTGEITPPQNESEFNKFNK